MASSEKATILDAEFVIETAQYRGQHLRQIFGDQPGTGLARGLAMHPDPDAGGLECRDALCQQPCDHSGQHIAGAGGGKPGRRIGGDGGAAVR